MPQDDGKPDVVWNVNSRNQEQDQIKRQLDRENNPLPESIAEYIQKARDELKEYEEQKKFYEKKRKRQIILELVDLLEKYEFPREWLRLIITQELGDYISASYVEKILAEKYPDEKRKKTKEQPTSQTAEIPQNDDKIPIEVSSTGESILGGSEDDRGSLQPPSMREVRIDSMTDVERQGEQGVKEIVKKLQDKIKGLETKCYQLDQLAKEGSMWKEKYTQLQQKSISYKSEIIKGTTDVEFGSEFVPIYIEYSFSTNQFSARIPEEVVRQILSRFAQRRGGYG